MIMDEKCPHCGSTNVETGIDYKERNACTEITTYYGRCMDCGKDFFMSEVLTVTSRIVAKDYNELDELVDEEMKKDMEEVRKANLPSDNMTENRVDKDEIYEEMCEKYDDDVWCGDAVASAIAGVTEDCDHDMSDGEIMHKFSDYIRDVLFDSLWRYVTDHKKEIVTDVRGYCKE